MPRTVIDKDTLKNLVETGECVVNIVNTDLVEKMNMTSASLSIDESAFTFADVESCSSSQVTPKSVKESPTRYGCTLRGVINVSDLPTGGTLVLLDVKCIYVRDDLYTDGNINHQLIDSVGKLGGDYFNLTSNKIVKIARKSGFYNLAKLGVMTLY